MAIKLITIINRENKTFEVSDRKPLLQELREKGVDLPYGCEYGGCITCAAKLIDGEVDQRSQVALNNRQINNGYIYGFSENYIKIKSIYTPKLENTLKKVKINNIEYNNMTCATGLIINNTQ